MRGEGQGSHGGCDRRVGCDKGSSVTGTARCDTAGRVLQGGNGLIVCKKRRRGDV